MTSTLLSIALFSFVQTALAFQIESPQEGQEVYAGSTLEVVLKPDADEEWREVLIQLSPLPYQNLTTDYKKTLTIPADLLGHHDLFVVASDKEGNVTILQRKIHIKMPENVDLKSIRVSPQRVVLYKLHPGCPPLDKQRFEMEDLYVCGNCTDDVRRNLTPSTSGTSYASSDEKIAIVSSEGKVIAQGIGTAKITVSHGNHMAEARVVVEPCRRLK